RVVATGPQDVRRLNRRWAQVLVPKLGWVRFRRSRPVPEARSYRVTRDRAGRWHVAFCAIPPPIFGPGTGEVVGIRRGGAGAVGVSGRPPPPGPGRPRRRAAAAPAGPGQARLHPSREAQGAAGPGARAATPGPPGLGGAAGPPTPPG